MKHLPTPPSLLKRDEYKVLWLLLHHSLNVMNIRYCGYTVVQDSFQIFHRWSLLCLIQNPRAAVCKESFSTSRFNLSALKSINSGCWFLLMSPHPQYISKLNDRHQNMDLRSSENTKQYKYQKLEYHIQAAEKQTIDEIFKETMGSREVP